MNNKIWLFGSYSFQGNPKALFLYMLKNFSDRECWWIADNKEQLALIKELNVPVVLANTNKANLLFSQANVYVVENNRESYPATMNPNIKVLNLWHGVGIKPIEFGLDPESRLSESIVKKYIKNNEIYKNNMLFLSTSQHMELHFKDQLKLSSEQFIRGSYPRNIVYKNKEVKTVNHEIVNNKKLNDYNRKILFAPTWRNVDHGYNFLQLLPDLTHLTEILESRGDLLIIKPHPLTIMDTNYQEIKEAFLDNKNLLFIENEIDIYEIFDKIDVGVIDYSSIYYDMMSSGINKFIRYIPDFNLHMEKEPLVLDYMEYTDGPIASDFEQLCELLNTTIPPSERNDILHDFFFGYSREYLGKNDNDSIYEQIQNIITQTEDTLISQTHLKSLYSFDVFDTLIKRKTLSPISIFHKVQEKIKSESLIANSYLIDNYVKVRRECESDVRDNMRKTVSERQSTKLEITFKQIFIRMQEVHQLSDSDINYLMQEEINAEFDAVEPIVEKIDLLKRHFGNGDDIILISDMYLPYATVKSLIAKACPELENIPLYISSEVGHQKSTGLLYKHIFFSIDYCYKQWVHYGDNRHADGTMPKRFGIKTFKHDMDSHIALEKFIANESPRYDHYQVATSMQRYRQSLLSSHSEYFNEVDYFGYSYFGSFIVPYLDWVINNAIINKYETLYFISRDGHYLKAAADIIIKNKSLNLKTSMIYASRRTWRLATPIDNLQTEFFSEYGSFAVINSFSEVVSASQFSEDELLKLVPELSIYVGQIDLTKDDISRITFLMFNSGQYRKRLSEYKSEYSARVIRYLNQTIDFDEKFAFVEFWGRGYAQDLMTETMEAAAGRPVDNPFYYVRCMRESQGKSIRHRFTNRPINFWFVEPIFATTPYNTVSEYIEIDGIITPCIVPNKNEFHESLMKGLCNYADDYSQLSVVDTNYLNRSISDLAYTYYLNTPSDQFICNVFARFEDNTGVYQEVKETAPILELSDLHEKEIKDLSRALKISLSRSTTVVRKEFERIASENGIKYAMPEPYKTVFPINGLESYSFSEKAQQLIYNLRNNKLFSDVRFAEVDKQDESISRNSFAIADTVWTASGIPRFSVDSGFITAHKNHTCLISHILFLDTYSLKGSDANLSIDVPTNIPLLVEYASTDNGEVYVTTNLGTFPLTSYDCCLIFSNGNLIESNSIRSVLINNSIESSELNLSDKVLSSPVIVDIQSAAVDPELNIIINTEYGDMVFNSNTMKFASKNINNYLYDLDDGILITREEVDIYSSPLLIERKPLKFSRYTLVQPTNLLLTSQGITVIESKHGYLPALKEYFYPGTIERTTDFSNDIKYQIQAYGDGSFHISSNYQLNSGPLTKRSTSSKLTKILIENKILDIQSILDKNHSVDNFESISDSCANNTNQALCFVIVTNSGNFPVDEKTIFLCDNIDEYHILKEQGYFRARCDISIFVDHTCTSQSKTSYSENEVFEVLEVIWTPSGTPVFKTNLGYVASLKNKLQSLSEKEISDSILQEFSSSLFYLQEETEVFKNSNLSIKSNIIIPKGKVLHLSGVYVHNHYISLKIDKIGFIKLNRSKLLKCRSDIVNYHYSLSSVKFITLKKSKIYSDLNFKKPSGISYPKGTIFIPSELSWSDGGTPRFKVQDGYISTNINFVDIKSFKRNISFKLTTKLNSIFKRV